MWKPSRHVVKPLAVIALTLVVSSCDSGGGSVSPSASSRRAPSLARPGPSTASLTFAGDPGLGGLATAAEVTCSFPDVEGLRISVSAQAPDSTHSYRIAVAADKVFVQVDSGAGATFRERNFEGTGVSGFDARRGAHVDARLTEGAPSAGIDRGSIGAITAVKS